MLHFIRVYTVCKVKKDLQTKEYNLLEIYNMSPLDMHNGLSQSYCIKPKGRIHLYTKGQNGHFSFFRTIMVSVLIAYMHMQCLYNSFLVYCLELAPGTVSLTANRAQGDASKHYSHYNNSQV